VPRAIIRSFFIVFYSTKAPLFCHECKNRPTLRIRGPAPMALKKANKTDSRSPLRAGGYMLLESWPGSLLLTLKKCILPPGQAIRVFLLKP